MKELDRFTSERLESLCDYRPNRVTNLINFREIAALARIALAAKRAEPVGYLEQNHLDYLRSGSDADIWPEGGAGDIPVYLAPQLNSPVIPEGWKLLPKEATLAMLTLLGLTGSFESMQERYANMLAAAPEKPL
ncbi:hypothetical protein PL78_19225 [Yersinia entomophaga]|uniref:Uncharacterized protein n=1 Tax=Yersinia entomophaga TaxID=935293 RepID=A0ABN4PY63_YERET|nr:hypothetical protein [Yersinia entomophaga]ANI31946.1 hypothetical protein PL78_19225 [Yersinia entomophaga]OWF84483.1 hypothetical protein B4914_19030 [Yersinia entomophaga]